MTIPAEIAALAPNDKNLQITLCLRGLVDAGLDIKDAWEVMFGEGSWSGMATQVHAALVTA
jgi:hypothetical protein